MLSEFPEFPKNNIEMLLKENIFFGSNHRFEKAEHIQITCLLTLLLNYLQGYSKVFQFYLQKNILENICDEFKPKETTATTTEIQSSTKNHIIAIGYINQTTT